MTTLRQFTMDDLLKFNNVNLDVLTETYNMAFYMSYMSRWPESFSGKYCTVLVLYSYSYSGMVVPVKDALIDGARPWVCRI